MTRCRGTVTLLLASLLGLALPSSFAQSSPPAPPRPPLSSVIAIVSDSETTIPQLVKGYVDRLARKQPLSGQAEFPLANLPLGRPEADQARAITGLGAPQVLLSWLDPLGSDDSRDALRFGANNDYNAYFGDGWSSDWKGDAVGSAPQFRGSGAAGWLWTNHEYVSNYPPSEFNAPNGQHLTLARKLKELGVLQNNVEAQRWDSGDVDKYVRAFKQQVGGSWYRIRFDPDTRRWSVDRTAGNVRFDATDKTLTTLTGQRLSARDHDDAGRPLAEGVVVGIMGDCAGGQTPWGTVVTAEENVQDYYGDFETAWTEHGQFISQAGFDPGKPISPYFAPSMAGYFGRISKVAETHNMDGYGYLVEIDPKASPGDPYRSASQGGQGTGHRKLGSMGRARWENAAFVVGKDYKLLPGEPIVFYGGDDRRGGRVYKWVGRRPYQLGMTRAQVRALLDEGDLYVAHFRDLDNDHGLTVGKKRPAEASPGRGVWVHLSTASKDPAPNAEALGKGRTVGEALRDNEWNGIGGFQSDDDVRRALYTASNKIGVRELNRPEDLEWNARDASGTPRLYIAFTSHARRVALDGQGRRFDPAKHTTDSPLRDERDGAIFALEEEDAGHPAASRGFRFFQVWNGRKGTGEHDAANPDNLLLDSAGGVWFGTDGNPGRNGTPDALYYLDLDSAHKSAGEEGPYGKAFRVVAVPSDAEATGPAFSSDEKTLFLSVQHPGENLPSEWPPRP